ncbi:MAG: tRNA pseudouridine(38-40) synthase TruA [Oscillatoriales cyanobacterium]|nr:MAG: tRNA pseudouridine(38-40) synthase TruA [Oscillatoriales cyanobacterium]
MTDNPKSPIENARSTQRVALVIQYLGTNFHGWQRQPNQRTVQEEIETAISTVLQRPVTLHAAGRTDAGVHAAAQVAHFDAGGPIPAHRWASVLNSRLAKDILIRASAKVEPTWQFVRPYAWHCYHAPVDESLIQAALTPLIGRHHLAAFHRAGSARPHSWVDVQAAECHRSGPLIYIEVQASGFLYGMMRLLVGLLVQVGQGERAIDNFTDIWVNERREMVKYAAPAQGLCLLRVGYSDFPFPPDVWYDTQPKLVISH